MRKCGSKHFDVVALKSGEMDRSLMRYPLADRSGHCPFSIPLPRAPVKYKLQREWRILRSSEFRPSDFSRSVYGCPNVPTSPIIRRWAREPVDAKDSVSFTSGRGNLTLASEDSSSIWPASLPTLPQIPDF